MLKFLTKLLTPPIETKEISFFNPRGIKLLDHQKTGIQFLLQRENAGLFDIMGLGKTMQILCTAQTLINQKKIDAAAVVCKYQHADVWIEEIEKHFNLPIFSVVGVSPKKRANPWPINKRGIFIINYALLSRALGTKQEENDITALKLRNGAVVKGQDAINFHTLLTKRRTMLILDESQYIANHKARVTKVLHGLSQEACRRVIATGTPVAERPDNIWSQLYFLDQGNTLGNSYNAFINQYAIFAQSRNRRNRWIVRFTNLERLRPKIESISIRRTEEDCPDLPPKVHMYSNLQAGQKQARLLNQVRNELIQGLNSMKMRVTLQKGTSFSSALQRAQIASAMPCVLDPSINESAKFNDLLDLLNSIGTKEQLVVWSVHRKVADAVAERLNKYRTSEYKTTVIHGGISKGVRKKSLDAFKEGKFRVCSATMATMREAVSLPKARHGFYIQRDFSLVNWVQSQKRHHRLTSTKKVIIHVPLLQGTLDAYIKNHLDGKYADAVTSTDRDVNVTLDKRSLLAALKRSA